MSVSSQEGSIDLTNGRRLVFPSYEAEILPTYLRVIDSSENEVNRWLLSDLAEHPLLMADICAAIEGGQKTTNYGLEGYVTLPWGGELRFPATDELTIVGDDFDYIRITDPDGYEVVYWNEDEWTEEPQLVVGAMLGYAQTGP